MYISYIRWFRKRSVNKFWHLHHFLNSNVFAWMSSNHCMNKRIPLNAWINAITTQKRIRCQYYLHQWMMQLDEKESPSTNKCHAHHQMLPKYVMNYSSAITNMVNGWNDELMGTTALKKKNERAIAMIHWIVEIVDNSLWFHTTVFVLCTQLFHIPYCFAWWMKAKKILNAAK